MVMTDGGEIDFAIEVNGEQHYKPVTAFGGNKKFARQKYNDTQKRKYCQNKQIPLVEIPYWDIEKGLVDINYIMEKAGIQKYLVPAFFHFVETSYIKRKEEMF